MNTDPSPVPLISRSDVSARERGLLVSLLCIGVGGMLARLLCAGVGLDLDLFHEMSLARATMLAGHVPLSDTFAYTPTVYPVVHHEWGSGMIFYFLMTHGGPPALMTLRLVLIGILLFTVISVAHLRGGSWVGIFLIGPTALIFLTIGFGTIRAQLFTMVFTAILMALLQLAQSHSPRWLLLWLPLHLVWLNVHAGFVVGMGLVVLDGVERTIRSRRIAWMHVLTISLSTTMIVINPYGNAYIPFLLRSLTMPRPLITEWMPVWTALPFLACFGVMAVLILYCLFIVGPRKLESLAVVLIALVLAFLHRRHLTLYGIFLLAMLPGYLERTPLILMMRTIWKRWRRLLSTFYAVVGIACLMVAIPKRPWVARIPSTLEDQRSGATILYPVAAVEYLRAHKIHGNVLAPFELGAFVSWELYPRVKVAVDGRYEVAYPPGQVEKFLRFFAAKDGWQQTLAKYPPTLILVPKSRPIAKELSHLPAWTAAYEDELFVLYIHNDLQPKRVITD